MIAKRKVKCNLKWFVPQMPSLLRSLGSPLSPSYRLQELEAGLEAIGAGSEAGEILGEGLGAAEM